MHAQLQSGAGPSPFCLSGVLCAGDTLETQSNCIYLRRPRVCQALRWTGKGFTPENSTRSNNYTKHQHKAHLVKIQRKFRKREEVPSGWEIKEGVAGCI